MWRVMAAAMKRAVITVPSQCSTGTRRDGLALSSLISTLRRIAEVGGRPGRGVARVMQRPPAGATGDFQHAAADEALRQRCFHRAQVGLAFGLEVGPFVRRGAGQRPASVHGGCGPAAPSAARRCRPAFRACGTAPRGHPPQPPGTCAQSFCTRRPRQSTAISLCLIRVQRVDTPLCPDLQKSRCRAPAAREGARHRPQHSDRVLRPPRKSRCFLGLLSLHQQ